MYAKALHIIFAVTWFAGLFYIVRLFIYQTEANQNKDEQAKEILCKQFRLMSFRLWYIITWPSAILTLAFGSLLIEKWLLASWLLPSWLLYKLGAVAVLFVFHCYCHRLFLDFRKNVYALSKFQLRILNEVPTVLLAVIVFLAVFKQIDDFWTGTVAVLLLLTSLYFGVRLYINRRKLAKQEQMTAPPAPPVPPESPAPPESS